MSRRSTILAGLLVLGTYARADAMCGPRFWLGTPDESHVPTKGTLYVYDDFEGRPARRVEARWVGGNGTLEQVTISPHVIQVSYDGASGSLLDVHGYRYVLDADWRAPTASPRALWFRHNVDKWECSHTDSISVVLDQTTAAVRARWRYAGKTSEWIMPPHTWRHGYEADVGKEIELGKIDCGDTTIPPGELRDGGRLELIAIRLDGTEVAVLDMPETITSAPYAEREADPLPYVENNAMPRELPVLVDHRLLAVLLALGGLALVWRLERNGREAR